MFDEIPKDSLNFYKKVYLCMGMNPWNFGSGKYKLPEYLREIQYQLRINAHHHTLDYPNSEQILNYNIAYNEEIIDNINVLTSTFTFTKEFIEYLGENCD